MSRACRRLPVGADVQPDGGSHFRVWAPRPREVRLLLEHAGGHVVEVPLQADGGGYLSVFVADAGAGQRYRYQLDGRPFADPASRFQPHGAFGPSAVVDPTAYRWSDRAWPGIRREGQILYELHAGTFTSEGTWRAAIEHLPDLAQTGITAIEVMPVAEFAGRFGWGYDGVFPFAPTHLYGTPDDFRAFVDHAHLLGLGVILDVVYNHLGPAGCVHREYAASYFTDRYKNEWGEPLNFDGPESDPVREYFVANAAYWIDEFHLDGLRIDAANTLHDASSEHVLAVITRRVREAARPRNVIVIAENESQNTRLLRAPSDDGFGLDAAWNDDFHHSAVVALTGRREAYYSDHRGAAQEFVSVAKRGYLFQGQRYAWHKCPRGTRTDGLPPAAFVNFLENHDQVANSGDGRRLHQRTSPGRYRAAAALLLLLPGTPMLFQGQEFGSSRPFLYFADHAPDLALLVQKGRAAFMTQFPSLASAEVQARLAVPHDRASFDRCKLRWEECDEHVEHRRLHEDLIVLRRSDAAFRRQAAGAVDGAVLAAEAFVLRYAVSSPRDERLLVINFGPDLVAEAFAEPLVAPPAGHIWRIRWASEDPAYGGLGVPEIVGDDGWRIPGHSATVLAAVESSHAGT